MGEEDFKRFMQLRNQPAVAAGNFWGEENMSLVLIPTVSQDMKGQLKLARKVIHVVDWANRKIWVTLLRYNVNKPEKSFAQFRFFPKKKEDEKFQQIVHVNSKFEEKIYLPDVMKSV